jgi:heptosyltransferase-3
MSQQFEIQPGDRILISRTDRLGDLILALPFADTIKARYPECRVDVMASLYASPILENNSRIDGVVRVQNDQLAVSRQYKKELQRKLVQGSYKAVVVLYPERRISQLLYKAGIPIRIGTAGRFHSVFFSHHIYHTRKANKKHELEYNLDFLKFFREGSTILMPAVYPLEKEINNARRILSEIGVEGDFVVLHPGSGGSALRWPIMNFVELSTVLGEAGVQVVISGSAEEGKQYETLSQEMGVNHTMIAGQTDLRTLAAVLSLADTVVANSTGPLHLSAAVGTRAVGLYPRQKVMSPTRWGPRGEGHRIIQPTAPECDCPPKKCRCMSTIPVTKVANEVLASIGRE